ncbi:MAG TPA: hypothetical protein VK348_14040 [Planctomycetota bacterium]|nr:hypothetical protein [Planctomycetota bacterium]
MSARIRREFARAVRVLRGVMLCAVSPTCLPLCAQAVDPLPQEVVVEAQRLVAAADPTVRGEAALVLGGSKDPRNYAAVLAVAKDQDLEARVRGLVALGLLSVPGAESLLDDTLQQSQTRVKPDGIGAAFALGLLPPDAGASVTRLLLRFQASSYKRQHDLLATLLAALADTPHPAAERALQQLLDDAANRDEGLRAQIITVLAAIDGALPAERVRKILDTGANEERLAAVQALLRRPADPAFLPLLLRLQAQDPAPEVRAAALAWLTHARHLPALDLAARAIKSIQPVEAAQGVRSALKLGGGGMREAVAERILATPSPTVQTAMLRAFDVAGTEPFGEACLKLAAERRKPIELRVAAARVAARVFEERSAVVLRDLFLEATDVATLLDLVSTLLAVHQQPPGLGRLLPAEVLADPQRLAARLQALLAANHPDAGRFLLQRLQGDSTPAEKAALLHAFRLARQQPLWSSERIARLPELLARLFR